MRKQHRPTRSRSFPHKELSFVSHAGPIVYFDAGEKTSPLVVLVHGLGCNLTHFEHVTEPLIEAGYRVAGLDLPGFGLSHKPKRELTVRALSHALWELIDHLGCDKATLIGHSLGGLVCADAAMFRPDRAEAVVLLSSAGLFKVPLPLRVAAATLLRPQLTTPALKKSARWLLTRAIADHSERTREFIEQCVGDEALAAQAEEGIDFVRELAETVWLMRRDLTTRHLLDETYRLTMPTLVLWGAEDRLLPGGEVAAWSRRLPQGRLEVLPGCGHMPHIEQPKQVLKHVLKLLSRVHGELQPAIPHSTQRQPPQRKEPETEVALMPRGRLRLV